MISGCTGSAIKPATRSLRIVAQSFQVQILKVFHLISLLLCEMIDAALLYAVIVIDGEKVLVNA